MTTPFLGPARCHHEAFGSRRFTSLPGRQICGLHFEAFQRKSEETWAEGSMISTVDTCPDVGGSGESAQAILDGP